MYENKKVLVIGMARSGIAAAKLLYNKGAIVTINDTKVEMTQAVLDLKGRVRFDLGGAPKNITSYDLVVMSPGVPTDLPFVLEAKNAGVVVIGALELGYQFAKGHFYGITGTNGKTTTTTLTNDIFNTAGEDAYAVGNIGNPLADLAETSTDNTRFVTEVSSFQLESTDQFNVHIAAILNLAPDHLNRHKTMEAYVEAKCRLFENQTSSDYLLLNHDDLNTRNLDVSNAKSKIVYFSKEKLDKGIYVEAGKIFVDLEEKTFIMDVEDIRVPGPHNIENVLAAAGIAFIAGIKPEYIKKAVHAFKGVAHRLEYVGTYKGIYCYNDSKGTNPESSIVGVNSMTKPTLLIAGGMDKGSVFDAFTETFKGKVKHLILLGETKELIKSTAAAQGFEATSFVETMEEAVKLAFDLGEEGDALLLSPACASWDMYPSFEVRGEHFKSCIKKEVL